MYNNRIAIKIVERNIGVNIKVSTAFADSICGIGSSKSWTIEATNLASVFTSSACMDVGGGYHRRLSFVEIVEVSQLVTGNGLNNDLSNDFMFGSRISSNTCLKFCYLQWKFFVLDRECSSERREWVLRGRRELHRIFWSCTFAWKMGNKNTSTINTIRRVWMIWPRKERSRGRPIPHNLFHLPELQCLQLVTGRSEAQGIFREAIPCCKYKREISVYGLWKKVFWLLFSRLITKSSERKWTAW